MRTRDQYLLVCGICNIVFFFSFYFVYFCVVYIYFAFGIGAGLLQSGDIGVGPDEPADWETYGMDIGDEKEEEVFLLEVKDAEQLINSGNFLDNFRLKSKWMERALGINEETSISNQYSMFRFEDVSFDMAEDVVKGGVDEIRTQLKRAESAKNLKKELLTLKKQFIHDRFDQRPIGWIEFSNIVE